MELITSLLPHQEAAVSKLLPLRIGALYMEMGTGKTRTTLEMAADRMRRGKIKQVLWLCPCSVKENLRADIEKHTKTYPDNIIICGIESISGSARIAGELLTKASAVPTMLVVDESNLVKNPHALRSMRITRIAERCPYRMILNGTPVSRTEADMFQQWYILDWRILGYKSYYSFAANHIEWDEKFRGKIRRVLNIDYLTDKIAPYSVQIKKDECLTLQEKRYHIHRYDLTSEQYRHYVAVRDEFLCEEVLHEDERTGIWVYKTLNALQQIASGERITSSPGEQFEHEPFFAVQRENPRIDALLEILEFRIHDEKAVIWCRYNHEVNAVMSVLAEDGFSCVEFTGSIPQKQRQENLKAFAEDVQFLVANKACAGYGLNLQHCHNAIYYTNDWDWSTRAQSEDRLHRIGQTETVHLYDIAAYASIDERVLACLSRKENMVESFKAHMHDKNFAAWLAGKEEEDLRDIHRADRGTEATGNPAVRKGA